MGSYFHNRLEKNWWMCIEQPSQVLGALGTHSAPWAGAKLRTHSPCHRTRVAQSQSQPPRQSWEGGFLIQKFAEVRVPEMLSP